MGFMLDQLRKKLKKKQAASNAGVSFKRIPRKDITFLPSNTTAGQITNFVNSRTIELITSVGGEDRFIEGDFTVDYIDRSSEKDYTRNETHTLESQVSKQNTGNWSNNNQEVDWETKSVSVESQIKDGLDINALQFYMIIIEFTELKETS
tara:strand:+ start:535 stop:984 length:450 start_codon:yes stop_codon:yes gene_type:complete